MTMNVRSEDDLRELFDCDSHDVASPEDILGRAVVVHSPRPRRVVIPLAVAATIATAVLVPAMIHARSTTHGAAASPGASTTAAPVLHTLPTSGGIDLHSTQLRLPAGYTLINHRFDQGRETFELVDTKDDLVSVTIYAAGSFDSAAMIGSGRQVTVNGHVAYYGKASYFDATSGLRAGSQSIYAWQVSGGRWVGIFEDGVTSPAKLVQANKLGTQVDAATATAQSAGMPLPYRIGDVGGLLPTSASLSWSNLQDELPDGTSRRKAIQPMTEASITFGTGTTAVTIDAASQDTVGKVAPTTTVRERPAAYLTPTPETTCTITINAAAKVSRKICKSGMSPIKLEVAYGDTVLSIIGNYSQAKLTEIAEQVTVVANPLDMKTWLDATK